MLKKLSFHCVIRRSFRKESFYSFNVNSREGGSPVLRHYALDEAFSLNHTSNSEHKDTWLSGLEFCRGQQ